MTEARLLPRPALVLMSVLTAVAVLLWTVLWSGWFDVRRVIVSGIPVSQVAVVRHAAGISRGTSMFGLDTGAVRARVARIPMVARVQVERDWPSTVKVIVTPRVAIVAVPSAARYELIDATGVAFATVAHVPRGMPVVTAGSAAAATASVAVLRALPPALRKQLTGVSAAQPWSITLQLRSGARVVWGSSADSAHKAAVLLALLRHPAHSYDVSTPDVVTTR